jgi:DNA-binding FadR family transcriptional regulator
VPGLGTERNVKVAQVQVQRLADQVTRGVAAGIINAPGSPLPSEQEICHQYGVSKTVAREVIGRLREMRLVTVHHGRRMQRRPESDWDYLDPLLLELQNGDGMRQLLVELGEVRRLLEPEVAARAAELRTVDELERMRAALDGMRAAIQDPDRYAEFDIAFHQAVIDAAHNRVASHIVDSIRSIMRTSRRYTNAIPGTLPRATDEHEAVFVALEAGDPDSARRAMIDHLDRNLAAFRS